ncbi:MAG: hypothetical protein J0J03_07865 [Leifsonia sp.]|nr:hypothetical protein [Leifsonia sp.]ODU63942.1 MAG: hypothetical protein ABT06_07790 [Leifsonia sp. SCN 70-46]
MKAHNDDGEDHLRGVEAAAVAVASLAGLASAYWDDSWHTTLGRDSALIPPHLLLYSSILLVGLILAVWGWRLVRTRSLRLAVRAPGFVLAVASAAATVLAAPADAFWHSAFGRDAVLWSPPHLLSVIATLVLLVAMLIGVNPRSSQIVRLTLGVALLGASQIVVMEYDTNVPQFPEALYLPLLVLTGLGSVWVISALTRGPLAITVTIVGYTVFRLAVLAALSLAGWIAPDMPLALLGLMVLDARRIGAWRWPLAVAAVTGLQLVASATGISSVGLIPVAQSAAIVISTVAIVVIVVAARRQHLWRIGALGIALALSLVVAFAPSAAQAHDPGQGPSFGTATMSVTGDGSGRIDVTVTDLEVSDGGQLAPIQLSARRAGQTLIETLTSGIGPVAEFSGSLVLPSDGLWFVYAQFDSHGRALELWLPVDQRLNAALIERRNVYEPAGVASVQPAQLIVGGLLLGLGGALIVAGAVEVRRRMRVLDV